MKPSTDQLITWFFVVAEAAKMMPTGAEEEYRESLAKLKGKERSGISSGVKQGVNDMLAMSEMWDAEIRRKVDEALKGRNLTPLPQMLIRLKGKQIRVLKRGRIKNDEEYYIVAELLSDLESGLTDKERVELGEVSAAYEESKKST